MITPYNKGIVTKELLLSPFHTDSFIAVTSPFLSAFSEWKSRFFVCVKEGFSWKKKLKPERSINLQKISILTAKAFYRLFEQGKSRHINQDGV